MKKIVFLIFFLLGSMACFANGPVLLFSDIESGPKNGWSTTEPDKGASVTIWGHGFGTTRGSSFVTVNGVDLKVEADYAVWGEHWPTQFFQRITFWLNDSMIDGLGEITVTVDGVESNPLPFTIRPGTIYFITESNPGGTGTLNNPYEVSTANYNWIDNMAPGDIYYFRDSKIYDGEYNGGNSVIWIRNSEQSGTASLPIALLAYPGESPKFTVNSYSVNHNNAVKFDNNYMVYSGFSIDSEWMGAAMHGDFHRFIGNDVVGLKNWHGAGTGIVVTKGDRNILLGNAIHGGNSQNRFDHGVYFSGCSDNGGTELGWNHFYDNDFGRGPIISINHQGDRCATGQILDAHFVFNNIVDCSAQRATAINVYDLSYDEGEEEPEPTYVYNNVFINCGTYDDTDSHVAYAPAMMHNAAGHVRFYNNTLYNSGYIGFRIRPHVTSTYIKNNIVHMSPDFPGPTGNHYTYIDDESVVSLSNNLYYGIGSYSPCTGCPVDSDNVNDSNPLFASPASLNFELQATSPAIDAGTSTLVFEVDPPAYAPITRDLNLLFRGDTPGIGAYESTPEIVSQVDNTNSPDFMIYPNPTSDYIQIKSGDKLAQLSIFNSMGQLVKTIEAPENQVFLDLSSGIYHLVFTTMDNRLLNQKLIVW
ncbi:T9SS type A sorting domain-containing protein [Fulvivirga kasyanovii]|nr:T9SS type A sorting domain-containing protein [Fulvivirga kasyanovii]